MVTGIAMCKDELDIIEHTVRHMASQVDALIVSDNGSTDGTRDALADLARELPLTVVDDAETGYYQSFKTSRLAAIAADQGAEWVVPFDSDEIWYSPFAPRIADLLSDVKWTSASVITAQLFDHVPTGIDPDVPNPIERIGHRRRKAAPLKKVACRPRPAVVIHQGNHDADHGGRIEDLLVVRHFPLRSPEQMVRKARNGGAAYAATNLPEEVGAHWRQWNQLSDEQLGDVFRRYYWAPEPTTELIYDPAPLPK